jgi:hypothetical protein
MIDFARKYTKYLVAGIAGLVSLVAYCITMAPTVSFWDCGEFVAAADTLGIPHPPGTPFFVFFARAIIVLLPMVEEVAKRVNYISVFSSAATVFLVALFAWDLLARLAPQAGKRVKSAAALCAGFLLAFSDTFWFNAVEAEVYGLAMFMLVLVSYLALKWLDSRDNKLLVLICYIGFLGVGVHLYTMLTIPAVFILLLIGDPRGVGQALVKRWPVWVSGTLLYSVVYAVGYFIPATLILLLALLLAVALTGREAPIRREFTLSLWFTIVALVGFSTHLYIPIRSELNPVIDENNPELNVKDENGKLQLSNLLNGENWTAFNNFVERKQYGSESMINRAFYRRGELSNQVLTFPHMGYGGYQIAQFLPYKVGEVLYYQPGLYTVTPEDNPPVVRGSLEFPTQMTTIGNSKGMQAFLFLLFNGLIFWTLYAACKRNRTIGIYLSALYIICSAGLLWYINFADGTKLENSDRQTWMRMVNEYNAQISATNGARLPAAPDPNTLNKLRLDSANGLATFSQDAAWRDWKRIQAAWTSVGLTAPDIPAPVHLEVRERDYFYAPAFIFMAMLYGLGIGFLLLALRERKDGLFQPVAFAAVVLCFAVPLFANYKEHNRHGLWVPWDYAYNLLMSCEPNAILFTNGDNDTFPLWFAQEVAGIRKDVRVVNLSLGNTDWYIKQILDVPPVLKLSYNHQTIDSKMAISEKNYKDADHQVDTWASKAKAAVPMYARQVEILQARLDTLRAQGADTAKAASDLQERKVRLQVVKALEDWTARRAGGTMQTQNKLVFDLALNNPDVPLHFSTTVSLNHAIGLDKYMVQKGMIWDMVKGIDSTPTQNFDAERTAYLVDSVFQTRGLGDGTAHIDLETMQLLSSYNMIYLQLANALKVSNPARALHYAELAQKQFPGEWRNAQMVAELKARQGDTAGAFAAIADMESKMGPDMALYLRESYRRLAHLKAMEDSQRTAAQAEVLDSLL